MTMMPTKRRLALPLTSCCWVAVLLLFEGGNAFVPSQSMTSRRGNVAGATSLKEQTTANEIDNAAQSSLAMNEVDRRSLLGGIAASMLGVSSSSLLLNNDYAAYAKQSTKNAKIPTWKLPNNVIMPTLALNTVGLSVEETTRAVGIAVVNGMTHIDFHPGKERDGVAQYLKSNPTSRKNLFLNTKIRKAPPGTSPSDAAANTRAQIDEDLSILGVDSVDMLMLRDSPDCDVIQAQWSVLEEALKEGKCRSVGVINFCRGALDCVLETAKVKPALNYYMLHVGMGPDAHGLRSYCTSRGIRTFAYGATGEPGPSSALLADPTVVSIANNRGKSPEEVALRWVLQTGAAVSVRPTLEFGLGLGACRDDGTCAAGLEKRAGSFNWELTKEEMGLLSELTSPDDNPTLFSSSGCPGAFVMPKK